MLGIFVLILIGIILTISAAHDPKGKSSKVEEIIYPKAFDNRELNDRQKAFLFKAVKEEEKINKMSLVEIVNELKEIEKQHLKDICDNAEFNVIEETLRRR